jgi:DNA-binding NtrC family response regulator
MNAVGVLRNQEGSESSLRNGQLQAYRPEGRGRADDATIEQLVGLLRLVAERELPLADVTDSYIDAVLRQTGGNKVQAARILGIDRKTLYRRAEKRHR